MPDRKRAQSTHSKLPVSDGFQGLTRTPLPSGSRYRVLLLGVGRMVRRPMGSGEREGGQALVETSLILLLLLTIISGIIQFGLLFQAQLTVTAAARHGVRLAAVGASDYAIDQGARGVCEGLDMSRLTIRITPTQSVRKRGMDTTVRVTYGMPASVFLLPNPMVVSAGLVMRVENNP